MVESFHCRWLSGETSVRIHLFPCAMEHSARHDISSDKEAGEAASGPRVAPSVAPARRGAEQTCHVPCSANGSPESHYVLRPLGGGLRHHLLPGDYVRTIPTVVC